MSASAVPSPPRAVALMRLSRHEAQARSTIAQRGAGLPVAFGSAWRAALQPLAVPEPLAEAAWTVRAEWAGAPFVLQWPAVAATELLASQLGDVSLPALPPELALAAAEAAMAGVIDQLQRLGRGAPQLLSLEAPSDAVAATAAAAGPAHAFRLELRASDGSQAVSARLQTDALGLLLLAGLVGRRALSAGALDEHAPLSLQAEIGHTRLSAADVASLGSGDVVLLDACHLGAGRTLWLTADGRAGLHAALAPSGDAAPPVLTVIHPWTATMPVSEPSADTPAASLDAVPVRLSFDIGELQFTLAQLRSLQAGQTLDLGHPLAGAVRIRANGALVGEGDLVEIDGQLGVSVRSLFAAG